MTAFTENEQLESDYNLFLIDNQGEIALLCHVGWRLLPPTIVKNRENLEKVENYFLSLTNVKEGYTVCPDWGSDSNGTESNDLHSGCLNLFSIPDNLANQDCSTEPSNPTAFSNPLAEQINSKDYFEFSS
jgi:hypothetical protein